LDEALDGNTVDLSDNALRRVIIRLLSFILSSGDNFWRYRLVEALRAANAGERDKFFEPAKTRRRGRPYQLDCCRAHAISHVYYLRGQGIKKHVALERVGKALAVSVETLRDWENTLGKDDWFRDEWNEATEASELEEETEQQADSILAIAKNFAAGSSELSQTRYMLRMIKAKYMLVTLQGEWGLEKLKADLRRLHSSSRCRKKASRHH
jgi:hypothetical protein